MFTWLAPSASGTWPENEPSAAGVTSTTVAPTSSSSRSPSVVPVTVTEAPSTTVPSAGAVTLSAGGSPPVSSRSFTWTSRK